MPLISVVVLNWNGIDNLKTCLSSLTKVTYKPLEIIVVDNASVDKSVDYVKKNFPKVIIVKNRKNYGYAKGNNIGFNKSKGKYILILNNDTIVTPDFLKPLGGVLEKNSYIGCIQPQIRLQRNKNILDGVGAFLTFTGFLYHFGYLKDRKDIKYNKQIKIFSAKGACLLLRRSVIDRVGLFDEDFFIFFEETDLCYRMWLAGFTVVYEPTSVIYHIGGADTTSSKSFFYERRLYLSMRNMFYSYLKNFGTRNLLTIMPVFIFVNIFLLMYYLISLRFNLMIIVCRALIWNVQNIERILKKRKIVQHKIRRISDSTLNKQIVRSPRLSYYRLLLVGKLNSYKDNSI